jgi:hypothetical protein
MARRIRIPRMKILLTPGQAVTAHGWARARRHLTWGDVLANERLTFSFLRDKCALPEHALHTLQPDIEAWVRAERVAVEDAPRLGLWGAHPIRDLHADFGALIRMHWAPEALKRMGVGLQARMGVRLASSLVLIWFLAQDLQGVGLTPETMFLFGYTLHGWVTLGLTRAYAEGIAPSTLYRLFGMTRQDVLAGLK